MAIGNRSHWIGSFGWLAIGLRCEFAVSSVSFRSAVCDSGRLVQSQQRHWNICHRFAKSTGFGRSRVCPKKHIACQQFNTHAGLSTHRLLRRSMSRRCKRRTAEAQLASVGLTSVSRRSHVGLTSVSRRSHRSRLCRSMNVSNSHEFNLQITSKVRRGLMPQASERMILWNRGLATCRPSQHANKARTCRGGTAASSGQHPIPLHPPTP